jgi:AmmeMemoRadiSam system protein B/AmmeMemoRadiSam system protein A
MDVRPPAVAGSFYPADARELKATISANLLRVAPESEPGPAPKALIVPHAGYVYSGPIAASAYAQLERLRGRVRRVVLLGPAHRVALRGLAAPEADALLTPLGSIPVDLDALRQLSDLPQVGFSERAHALEHSLEVQLPFLQHVLGAFRLVPLVVGEASDTEVSQVIERLWGGDETLFVISSDLSHYHDYATARRMDTASCSAIEALEPESLDGESACGYVPLRGLLRAARRHGLAVRTLDLRNSGDTAGDRDRVVGYGAWTLAPRDPVDASRSEDEKRNDAMLLDLARRAIAVGLERGSAPAIDPSALPPELGAPGACFVTLRSPGGELRGCIGSLEATRSLAEDVAASAWAAASRDHRVPPIHRGELASLRIGISVLSPLEAIQAHSLGDLAGRLRPGIDGLVLEDRGARGTLLPQVWEQVHDPREFVGAVWAKAGLPADHWSPNLRAHRYGARKLGPA